MPPAQPAFPQPSAFPQPDPAAGSPFFPAPSTPAPTEPPPASTTPAYEAPAYEAPAYEAAPPSFAAPSSFPAPATEPPVAAQSPSAFPPLVPDAAETPSAPVGDPFGSLFAADDDTAARLAAAAPPSVEPLAAPDMGTSIADDDPMKSLFGLHTEEQPAIAPDLPLSPAVPVEAVPVEPELQPQLQPSQAEWSQLPTHQPDDPVLPPRLEPDFATSPAEASAAAPVASGSYSLTMPSGAPPADDDPTAGTQFFGGGTGEWEEPPDLDRTTVGEKVAFALAFLVPPAGLIASIVAAVQSSRERGWVHGFVRAALVIALVMTVVAGFAGAFFYKQLEDARKHDVLVASSAQFCATIADRPDMIEPPAFGFPAPAATIADTLTAIQEYVDRWNALAAVSPSGIRPDVTRVADSASDILDKITTTRIVNNDENVAVMSSVAESTNLVGWADAYCE
jgi:hypothetical protein